MDVKEYLRLKEEVDKLKRDLIRAEATLEQGQAQLLKEFDCRDEKEAKKLLAKMQKEYDGLTAEYSRKMFDYNKVWGEQLESET